MFIPEDVLKKVADPAVMMRATNKANASSAASERANAYFYGNTGDSVERRLPDSGGYGGGGSILGNGYDLFQGTGPAGGSYGALGFGTYFGGAANGFAGGRHGPFGSYGSGGFTYLRKFTSNASFNHSIIASTMMAYLGYGVVRNVIDTYTNFATEGIQIEHADASVKKFYDVWAQKVNLQDRVQNVFMNLFVTGNVFIHRRWATLTDKEKRAMKRAEGSEKIDGNIVLRGKTKDTTIETDEDFLDWFLAGNASDIGKEDRTSAAPMTPHEELHPKNREKRIPWGYTMLNPLQMELRGKRIQGRHHWVMALDRRDTLDIAKGLGYNRGNELGTTKINLPKEFVRRVKPYEGPGAGYVSEITLSKEELTVVQETKFDWFDWSIPFVWPALRPLYFKDCLRNMEIKACSSVINSIFLFKLGDIQAGLPAEDEHFERLADMLAQPGQAMNIIWNEAIDADVIQADVKGIFDPKKHESADRDILTALGVPEVLLGGKGGNFSNSYIAVSSLLERLESARNKVRTWLMTELKIIADAMGFRKMPDVRFGRTSLTDDKSEKQFILGLLDRGVISVDKVLQEVNTTVEVQAKQQEREQKLQGKKTKVMDIKGPFIKEPPKPPVGAKKPAAGPSKPKPKTPNGRPGGTSTGPTGKQDKPRGPKGQGLADMDAYEEMLGEAREALNTYEKYIQDRWCRSKGIKYIKQAPHEEKERLENLIYNVFSHMPSPSVEHRADDFIIEMLQSPAAEETKADVLSIYHRKLADYKTKFNKAASREMRRQFIVSAWTQCAVVGSMSGFQSI